LNNLKKNGTNTYEKLFAGKYASSDTNEFMAECFTKYKLKTNPGKCAEIAG